MPRTARRTFTRDQLTRALGAIDREDLAAGMYARPMDYSDGGGSALAFDYDDAGDLGLFLVVVATLAHVAPDGADFAAALHLDVPAHPDGVTGHRGAYWPGWVLEEPTLDQWTDARNACLSCRALELNDDGPCTPHAVAPWHSAPVAVA